MRITSAGSGRWQIRSGFDGVTFLEGNALSRILESLVPLLDGTHTVAEMAVVLGKGVTAAELKDVLDCLFGEGVLIEGTAAEADLPWLRTAIEANGADPSSMIEKVGAIPLVVCARSYIGDALAASLRRQGFQQTFELGDRLGSGQGIPALEAHPNGLAVIVETDWRPDDIIAFNAWTMTHQRRWVLVGAWNSRVMIGPLFIPHQTPCYECYRKRLDSHRHHLNAFRIFDAARSARTAMWKPEPLLPGIADLAAGVLSQQLFALFTGMQQECLTGSVLIFHPKDWSVCRETILRIPWCPACGVRTDP